LAERSAVKSDIAATRAIKPAQAVEQGRLAGAVRPDQTHDTPAGNPECHLVESDNTAKAHTDAGDLEQRGGGIEGGRSAVRDFGHAARCVMARSSSATLRL